MQITQFKTRLNEARIESIAKQIIANLTKKRLISIKETDVGAVIYAVMRLMLADQKIEAEIEAEAMKVLQAYEQKVAPGTPQWQVVFTQTKERIAKKRGYIF